jgi:hypothetical protein
MPEKTLVGYEVILGYRAVHLSYNGTDEWFAPDLGCEEMKAALNVTGPDGKKIHAERQVLEVTTGEPDPSLFTVPADYREMSPAEADQAYADKFEKGVLPSCLRRNQPARMEKYAKFGPSGPNAVMK